MSARVLGQLDRLQGEVEVPGWDAIYWLAVGELSLLPLRYFFLIELSLNGPFQCRFPIFSHLC